MILKQQNRGPYCGFLLQIYTYILICIYIYIYIHIHHLGNSVLGQVPDPKRLKGHLWTGKPHVGLVGERPMVALWVNMKSKYAGDRKEDHKFDNLSCIS